MTSERAEAAAEPPADIPEDATEPASAEAPALPERAQPPAPDALGSPKDSEPAEPASTDDDEFAPRKPVEANMAWYVLKVQSNREDSIRDAMMRRLKIAGLEDYVAEIVVPAEKVSEIKAGKKKVSERKLYPGYIMIRLDLNDDVWFEIRETPGVGDFVGSGAKPVPMSPQDVDRMLGRTQEVEQAGPRLKINFQKGDRVKVREGPFENYEGNVDEVNEAKGLVKVMIQVFGRPVPLELEYWQVEAV